MNDSESITAEHVKNFVRKLHFDFDMSESKFERIEEYEDFWQSNKNDYLKFLIQNHESFEKNLDVFLDKNESLIEKIKLDEELFVLLLKEFNELRYFITDEKNKKESQVIKDFISHMKQDGIAIKRKLFSKEDLNELIRFQADVEYSLGKDVHDAGYVGISNRNNQYQAFNRKQKINDGQLRLQSKNIGFLTYSDE